MTQRKAKSARCACVQTRMVSWWLCMLVGVSPFVLAPQFAVADEVESPSAELLEFLGEFGGADGKWVDPMALDAEGEDSSAEQDLR